MVTILRFSLGAVTSLRRRNTLQKSSCYKFYNKKLLRLIVGTLGKVVKVNYNTTVRKRGKFARFAVVVDLMKPLNVFVELMVPHFVLSMRGFLRFATSVDAMATGKMNARQ
ncbi:hypothetical protein V6Z11_A05G439900 [Gossypium hirsutum]|uniref:Uncharacterized protein n=1 Tax=Gossypium tomentosum TaxID=34277 RepID=A0A5D2QS70_GOSTO|nr:hypothetical protein ES332_A05G441300v1 [Gossypium tomentosum]